MSSQKGREIHGRAAKIREEGKHLEALQLQDEATLAYQKDKDILGLAEILADRSLVLRHLFDETDDKNFLIIAKHEMMASVEMAEQSGSKEALALPYFNLAKIQQDLEELDAAVSSYQKAVDSQTQNPTPEHNRPAVLLDMQIHLATCQYQAGDKLALDRALQALALLEEANEVKYNKDVWLSGGHMRITQILKEDDPEKAAEHLQKAKEIIDANPDLKLRKGQWEKLAASFKQN
ncbi:MAG: hypothetical protein HYW45_01180 [Candidatus Daviesbacteria bacterium]|nr:MAG: hypothetical protein HYW45_01180 [Candidatus Daviesbacteria bacterium]